MSGENFILPFFLEGETVPSLCTRAAILSPGTSKDDVWFALSGVRCRPPLAGPAGLARVAEGFGISDPGAIIDGHTCLPYVAPFMSKTSLAEAKNWMMIRAGGRQ